MEQDYTPDFAWMMVRHGKARDGYRRAFVAMLAGGLGLTALALLAPTAQGLLLTTGLLLAALAVVPLKEMLERGERIEGLEVLQEEWRDLAARTDLAGRDQLLQLIARLYRKPA